MTARLLSWWHYIIKHWKVALLIVAFVGVTVLICIWLFRFVNRIEWPLWVLISVILIGIVLLVLLIHEGYSAPWTGFGGYDKITKEYTDGQSTTTTTDQQPGKTFWDWLQLLIIPLVLAGATLGFGLWQAHLADLQHERDQQRALDQQQATILQTYIDNIQDLLLKYHLRTSSPTGDVATLARSRTLTALRRLDPVRKGILLEFLWEDRLIGFPIMNSDGTFDKILNPYFSLAFADLHGADLQGDLLSATDLSGANLSGANMSCSVLANAKLCTDLRGASLRVVNLSGANLTGASLDCLPQIGSRLVCTTLRGANLRDANLQGTFLKYADLSCLAPNNKINQLCTDLSDANLNGTMLYEANLSGANLSSVKYLTQQQLDQVYSCKGAILPPGLTCHHN